MGWILILAVATAFAVGFFIGRFTTQQSQHQAEQDVELQNTKTEFERYKAEVSEHLRETSELMHAAESNYQQLSEQLMRTKHLLTNAQDVEPAPHGAVPASAGELPPKDYSGTASGLLKQEEKVD